MQAKTSTTRNAIDNNYVATTCSIFQNNTLVWDIADRERHYTLCPENKVEGKIRAETTSYKSTDTEV